MQFYISLEAVNNGYFLHLRSKRVSFAHRLFSSPNTSSNNVWYLIYMDSSGPLSIPSINGRIEYFRTGLWVQHFCTNNSSYTSKKILNILELLSFLFSNRFLASQELREMREYLTCVLSGSVFAFWEVKNNYNNNSPQLQETFSQKLLQISISLCKK